MISLNVKYFKKKITKCVDNANERMYYICVLTIGLLAVLLIVLLLMFLLEKHKALAYWQEKADKQAETLEQLDSEITDLNIQISELERTISFYESWQCTSGGKTMNGFDLMVIIIGCFLVADLQGYFEEE